MTPYKLIITASFRARGREAEAICRAIGIEPVDNELAFGFRAEAELPPDRVDDVVAPDRNHRSVDLDRQGVLALRPGDYVAQAASYGGLEVRAVDGGVPPERLLAIYDEVAGPRAERGRRCRGFEDRIAGVLATYRETFEGADDVIAYQVLADLVEHFKPAKFDVRALLEEAIRDVESGVFSDGVAS